MSIKRKSVTIHLGRAFITEEREKQHGSLFIWLTHELWPNNPLKLLSCLSHEGGTDYSTGSHTPGGRNHR